MTGRDETDFEEAKAMRIDDLVRRAVPEEEVPHELIERLGLASPASADVFDFAAERSRRTQAAAAAQTGWWSWDRRKAASILVLVGLGLSSMVWLTAPGAKQQEPAYRVLGDAPQAGAQANALVIFAADVDAREARDIVVADGAAIVGERTPAGAWKLAVDPVRRDAVLAQLRGRGDVSLAEPLDGAGQ